MSQSSNDSPDTSSQPRRRRSSAKGKTKGAASTSNATGKRSGRTTGRNSTKSMRDALAHITDRPKRRSRKAPAETSAPAPVMNQSETAPREMAHDSTAIAVVDAPTTAELETALESLEITIEAVEPAPAPADDQTITDEIEAIDALASETQTIMERLLAAVDDHSGVADPAPTESMMEAVTGATDIEVELIEDDAVTIENPTEPVGGANDDAVAIAIDYASGDPDSAAGAQETMVTIASSSPAGTLTVAAPATATSPTDIRANDTFMFVKLVAPFLLGVGAGMLIGMMV